MDKTINVQISNEGKVFVETENYKGEACVKSIKELFSEFLDIDDFELKSDYYEEDENLYNEVDIKL